VSNVRDAFEFQQCGNGFVEIQVETWNMVNELWTVGHEMRMTNGFVGPWTEADSEAEDQACNIEIFAETAWFFLFLLIFFLLIFFAILTFV
jgi:hypothetical protein